MARLEMCDPSLGGACVRVGVRDGTGTEGVDVTVEVVVGVGVTVGVVVGVGHEENAFGVLDWQELQAPSGLSGSPRCSPVKVSVTMMCTPTVVMPAAKNQLPADPARIERLGDDFDVGRIEEPEVAGLGGEVDGVGRAALAGCGLPAGLDREAAVDAEGGVRGGAALREGRRLGESGKGDGILVERLFRIAEAFRSSRAAGEGLGIGDGLEGPAQGVRVGLGLIGRRVGDVDLDLEVGQAAGEEPVVLLVEHRSGS